MPERGSVFWPLRPRPLTSPLCRVSRVRSDVAGDRRPASPDVAPAAEVMVPIVDEDDIPLTWDPVPVPRPTYTMKAKAERPEVAPAAVTPDPAPVRRETVGDATAYERQRAAGA